jgi:hypothetical protein
VGGGLEFEISGSSSSDTWGVCWANKGIQLLCSKTADIERPVGMDDKSETMVSEPNEFCDKKSSTNVHKIVSHLKDRDPA